MNQDPLRTKLWKESIPVGMPQAVFLILKIEKCEEDKKNPRLKASLINEQQKSLLEN